MIPKPPRSGSPLVGFAPTVQTHVSWDKTQRCKTNAPSLHSQPIQPIGSPPRQGTTGSDHFNLRDASCVPGLLCDPKCPSRTRNLANGIGPECSSTFWNYTLSVRDVDADFRTDWSRLGRCWRPAAVDRVNPQVPCEYQGLNFNGSYDPASEGDRRLYRWATTKGGHVSGRQRFDRSAAEKAFRHPSVQPATTRWRPVRVAERT